MKKLKMKEIKKNKTLAPFQYLLMHCMQKLCPHGVDAGLVNTSRHMEHWNCSSHKKLSYRDIFLQAKERRKQSLGEFQHMDDNICDFKQHKPHN